MEKIGYIIVLFHREDLLPDLFESIARQTFQPAFIYLVDNAPSAEMRNTVNHWKQKLSWEHIIHIEQTENKGAAEANNIGIRLAIQDGCTACILSNTDIVYDDPDLFQKLAALSAENDLKIIAPKIYYYQSPKIWYAGGDIVKWKGGVVHYFDTKTDKDESIQSGFTGYAPTTFVFIKTEVFQKTGLLNVQYFLYMEDTEWMYRARLAGYHIWFAADLRLEHKVSVTTGGKYSSMSMYYNTRNRFYFVRQYTGFFTKMLAVCFVIASTFYFLLLSNGRKPWRAYFRAIKDGLTKKIIPVQHSC